MTTKQVDFGHYNFSEYVIKQRWISFWHQLDEVVALAPSEVLEIGPGTGLFKLVLEKFGIRIETIDLDPDLRPSCIASADNLPIKNMAYDCVCAFQVLEHLPYNIALKAFGEMIRVSKRNVVISLPDAERIWTYTMHIPKLGLRTFHIIKPMSRRDIHKFDGEHHWEINKQGFHLEKVISDLSNFNNKLIKTFRVDEYLYHRFFVFERCGLEFDVVKGSPTDHSLS